MVSNRKFDGINFLWWITCRTICCSIIIIMYLEWSSFLLYHKWRVTYDPDEAKRNRSDWWHIFFTRKLSSHQYVHCKCTLYFLTFSLLFWLKMPPFLMVKKLDSDSCHYITLMLHTCICPHTVVIRSAYKSRICLELKLCFVRHLQHITKGILVVNNKGHNVLEKHTALMCRHFFMLGVQGTHSCSEWNCRSKKGFNFVFV